MSCHISGEVLGFGDHALVDWASFCREVAIDAVMVHSEMIGGVGEEVEIDESKFGKSMFITLSVLFIDNNIVFYVLVLGKYHRGKRVDGMWVFGGVQRGSDLCFLVPVPDRTQVTLIALIKAWIRPGTIIYSDCWLAYQDIMLVCFD